MGRLAGVTTRFDGSWPLRRRSSRRYLARETLWWALARDLCVAGSLRTSSAARSSTCSTFPIGAAVPRPEWMVVGAAPSLCKAVSPGFIRPSKCCGRRRTSAVRSTPGRRAGLYGSSMRWPRQLRYVAGQSHVRARRAINDHSPACFAWCRADHATRDPWAQPVAMAQPVEVTPEALKPFMGGLSPHGPGLSFRW